MSLVAPASARRDVTMVGVSIPIPAPFGPELQWRRASYGDPLAAETPAHITRLGPTEVEDRDLDELGAHLHAAAGSVDPFVVVLRGTGTFRPVSDVVFVQVARGIAACEQLEHGIRRGRWGTALTFPYHPHITVAHDVQPDMLELAYHGLSDLSAEFPVPHFTEFEQTPSGVWAVAREYPLTGPPR